MRSLVALAAIVSLASAEDWAVGQTVPTTSGKVTGQASSWKKDVSEYLGIPFASPPVGELRWAAPQKLVQPDKPISATKYGDQCAEGVSDQAKRAGKSLETIGAFDGPKDEDCLYLNIWTKPQAGEKNKAVLLWIYGGAFILGSGSNPLYNGALLAEEQDVVVVNFNYRLGAFGFPGVPLPETNPGILDQRVVIEWVRDNIEKFGGDPARITLFGQSAGAASVDIHNYAFKEDPIINAYIPMSGSVSLTNSLGANAGEAAWNKLAAALGCGNSTTPQASLPCLRTKDTAAILNASTPAESNSLGAWGPKADGRVVFPDYAVRRAQGNFNRRPLLIGNVDNEGATFADQPGGADLISLQFGCGTAGGAVARTNASVPAWRYLYTAHFPNLALPSGATGAFHGSELGVLYGTNEIRGKEPDTDAEKRLGRRLRDAWAGFAKKPETALLRLGWPKYDPKKNTIIVIGGIDDDEITLQSPAVIDAPCAALVAPRPGNATVPAAISSSLIPATASPVRAAELDSFVHPASPHTSTKFAWSWKPRPQATASALPSRWPAPRGKLVLPRPWDQQQYPKWQTPRTS